VQVTHQSEELFFDEEPEFCDAQYRSTRDAVRPVLSPCGHGRALLLIGWPHAYALKMSWFLATASLRGVISSRDVPAGVLQPVFGVALGRHAVPARAPPLPHDAALQVRPCHAALRAEYPRPSTLQRLASCLCMTAPACRLRGGGRRPRRRCLSSLRCRYPALVPHVKKFAEDNNLEFRQTPEFELLKMNVDLYKKVALLEPQPGAKGSRPESQKTDVASVLASAVVKGK